MIKCQTCGTQNLDSSQYCDECGDSLQKYQAPENPNSISENRSINSEPQPQEYPIYQSASETSIGVPPEFEENNLFEEPESISEDNNTQEKIEPIPDENKTSLQKAENILPAEISKSVHAKLIIERGQSIGTEFSLTSNESNIGRWDADNGVFPDIDLDAHDAEAKVSRRHARIHYNNGQYMLEDLGSTNGTFINRGRRLIPGSPHVLNDGDEIIVGKTFLRFQVNK